MVHTAPVHAVIGGFHRHEIDSNTPQAARYHEERAKGRRIPIVGVSDAHGCERGELFGWYYTLVFAPSLDLDDLIEAIKSGYSVAVEALPGEAARAYGPFRLVKFALYCLREIFPQHDGLCAEEGRLMMSCAAGETDAADRLAFFTGQTADGHVRPPWDRDRDTAGKAGFLLSKGIFCLSTGLGPFCGS